MQARVGDPVRRRVGLSHRPARLQQPGALVTGQGARGGEAGRAGFDDAPEVQGVLERGTASDAVHRGRFAGPPGCVAGIRDDRAATASAAGLDETGVAQRGDRLAQGVAGDREPFGEVTLGWELFTDDEDAEPDRGGELLDGGLEDVADGRAQDGVGQPGGRRRRLLRGHGSEDSGAMVLV